jgi:uncharacterized radical SAM protein YgiQ
MSAMFLPTTKAEVKALGWDKLDVILLTGDAYIDSPFVGVAMIGKVLLNAGYRVGIIAQPEVKSDIDITRLGEPSLFWGITSGCVDSMVANYTALKKPKRQDDFTPGGKNLKRPDRAVIVYANLIRRYFKNTKPLVLGGIEASLRRITHYDYWDDALRKSVLFDAKADILVYGMGEKAVLDLAESFKLSKGITEIKGICYISNAARQDYIQLPSYDEAKTDKHKFEEMFKLFYQNNDPRTAKGLYQKQDNRYLIQNPPQLGLSSKELSATYNLDYEREVHPYYRNAGPVKALETIKFSLTTHRGCFGECNFCSIALHQGRTVISRTEASIIKEAQVLTQLSGFKGYILDVGGPTANMYGIECGKKFKSGACWNKRCLYPVICRQLKPDHKKQLELLQRLRKIPGVKKVFVASGIRHDLVLEDKSSGMEYLEELVKHHISGQLKLAPEHTGDKVLNLMGKPGKEVLIKFRQEFTRLNKALGKKQFLTYYFIAAHPGCNFDDMLKLKDFIKKELKLHPEQVQLFTPLPSTYSALMSYTGIDPFTGERIFVEKDAKRKEAQKQAIIN